MKKPEVTLHRRKIGNPYRYNRYPINFSTRVGTTVHSRLSNLSSNHLSPLFFSISLNQDSVFHLILQHPSLYLSKDRAQVRRKVRTFFYFSRTLSRSFAKKKVYAFCIIVEQINSSTYYASAWMRKYCEVLPLWKTTGENATLSRILGIEKRG